MNKLISLLKLFLGLNETLDGVSIVRTIAADIEAVKKKLKEAQALISAEITQNEDAVAALHEARTDLLIHHETATAILDTLPKTAQ